MALSEAQLLGYAETVHKTFGEERAAMKAAGYDPDTMAKNLRELHDEVVEVGTKQEDLKRELRDTTKRLEVLRKRLNNLTSGGVDALMTAVERSSPAAKIIRRLRSRIQKPNGDPTPPVEPAPIKTA